MLFLHIGDQRFTNIATESPELIRVGRTDQCTDLYRSFLCVSDHQGPCSFIPRGMRFNVSKKLLPEFVHGQMIVEMEKYGTQKFRRAARPVFERLLQEIADWNNQTSLVPQMDDHLRKRDFLHLA